MSTEKLPQDMQDTQITLTTAGAPGAIAIIQVTGDGAGELIFNITGLNVLKIAVPKKAKFSDIDEGVVIKVCHNAYQLMPHGGKRVVQRLLDELVNHGAIYQGSPSAAQLYLEAANAIEADALSVCANAASPLALDLLAAQPKIWQKILTKNKLENQDKRKIIKRAQTLNKLITPPSVVVVGRANVGKSTLTNFVTGRNVSLIADLPGTTRDWVGALAEIACSSAQDDTNANTKALAVRWMDTPGLRMSADDIEQNAIKIMRKEIENADVIIAMRDIETNWPDSENLPREPDIWVVNKVDKKAEKLAIANSNAQGKSKDNPLQISAKDGVGIDSINDAVINTLGLDDIGADELWAFSSALISWAQGKLSNSDLHAYLST